MLDSLCEFSGVRKPLNRNVVAASTLLAAAGICNLVHLISKPILHQRLMALKADPFLIDSSRALTLILGLFLVYLSVAVWQRKRAAFWLAVITLTAAIAVHLLHSHLWLTMGALVVALAVVLMARREFRVRSDPRGVMRGVFLAAGVMTLAVIYAVVGFWLLDPIDFGVDFDLVESLGRGTRHILFLGNPDISPRTANGAWFLKTLHWSAFAALALALFSIFRPVSYVYNTLPKERSRAKSIAEKAGVSSLDYFKLMEDKSFYFSPSGQTFFAYRTVWDVAVVLGTR